MMFPFRMLKVKENISTLSCTRKYYFKTLEKRSHAAKISLNIKNFFVLLFVEYEEQIYPVHFLCIQCYTLCLSIKSFFRKCFHG